MSLVMRDLGRRYVQYVNFAYRRSGTLWEGRFKASLVDMETYFLRCCRYVELNPMRAGIVARPEEYRWSSHCFYALGREDPVLSAHHEYQVLGKSEGERQKAYRDLFSSHLDEKALTDIRGAVNRGWPLGSARFKDQIEVELRCAARPPKRGRPSRQTNLRGDSMREI